MFMPAFATSTELTRHGFRFVLRMLPDDRVMTAQTASVAALFGYRRVVVLHQVEDDDRKTAYLFEDFARFFDIEVPFRASFFGADSNYRHLINEFGGMAFDAIFLAADTEPGARMLRQLRELGIRTPVLGSHKLSLGPLQELSQEAGDLTVVPTVFSRESNNPLNRRFGADYSKVFGTAPHQAAAQGYDSVKILATMIQRAGTTEPRALASTAHFSGPIAGVTGIHAFDEDGNLHAKSYRFQVLRQGHWEPLPGIHLPFLMQQFEAGMDTADAVTSALILAQPEQARVAGIETDSSRTETMDGAAADQQQAGQPADGGVPARLAKNRQAGERTGVQAYTDNLGAAGERQLKWLSIAHQMLGFNRLGLVARASERSGAAAIALARAGAARLGFELEVCELSEQSERQVVLRSLDSGDDAAETLTKRDEALACYSQLATRVDAVYVLTESGLDAGYLRQLNRGLRQFGVSSFALGDLAGSDYGLTLALQDREADFGKPSVAARFNGLLNGTAVSELARTISLLPVVAMNLKASQALGISPSPPALALVSQVLDPPSSDPSMSLDPPMSLRDERRP
jgi:ABC-type branched-subunit amino acid transport system substrate-binding protein